MTDTDTTARYLVATLENHLRANEILPDWEHGYEIAKAIEAAAGPWLNLSIPHGATALAVARDILSDDSIAYLIDSATARDLVAEWAVSLTECPDDEVWCIDGERVAYAVGKGFCWQLSEGDGDGGPTVLNIRRREEASDIASTMDAIRRDDEDLRGALCGMCHTTRPYRDIDGDGCLEPSASPYCPTCGAEYEEGAGYRERDATCPHCHAPAVWVPAHGDAPGHDVCTLCAAVCDLDPTHGPTWSPPASDYLAVWTARPHEYLR